MKPWWRKEPLSDPEEALLQKVFEAHEQSTLRSNASTEAVRMAAFGSGSYTQALIAAISMLGPDGLHGPIERTMEWMEKPLHELDLAIRNQDKVPGWGNSFVRNGPDKIWEGVDRHLEGYFSFEYHRIAATTLLLHHHGKMIYPNPSAYTAATAIALKVPPQVALWIPISARLESWTRLAMEALV